MATRAWEERGVNRSDYPKHPADVVRFDTNILISCSSLVRGTGLDIGGILLYSVFYLICCIEYFPSTTISGATPPPQHKKPPQKHRPGI